MSREMTETMSWHLTREAAQETRDRLDQRVVRVATGGSYYVRRGWLLWRVVKRYTLP